MTVASRKTATASVKPNCCRPMSRVKAKTMATATMTMAAPKGRRIDLELQAVDIHQVLRLFSEIGRVNIIAKPGVSGTVTAKLRGVPWTDALRGILRSLHLGMIWEGNVIYVMPLAGT